MSENFTPEANPNAPDSVILTDLVDTYNTVTGRKFPTRWSNIKHLLSAGVSSVDGTPDRITVAPNVGAVIVNIAETYVGQTSITTLGTITTGTWNATVISPVYGGTGIANNVASTWTISGAFATTITVTAVTAVTLPITGTLYGTRANSITSAQLATSLTDETGTLLAVFSDSPVFTTNISTPQITGTGASNKGLTLVNTVTASTAAAYGTYTAPTLSAAANNDILYGVYIAPTFTLGAFTGTNSFGLGMICGTAQIRIGNLTGSTSTAAIYMTPNTPSATTNFALSYTTTQTNLNNEAATGTLNLKLAGTTALTLRGASSGASPQFDFTPPNRTNQTLSTNNPNFKFTGASTQKAVGADPLQYFAYFTSNTLAYTAGSTCTLAASMAIEYITAGTNVTAITTSVALYIPTKSLTTTTNGVGVYIEPPTSGTTSNIGLVITAGSTTSAPLKYTSGSVLTTPIVGVKEFLTDDFYQTGTTGATRKSIRDLVYRGISALRTLDGSDELVNCTANTFTVTLPTAVGYNKQYTIVNSGTGVITIATTSAQTISGNASGVLTLNQWDTIVLRSDGANWIKIN